MPVTTTFPGIYIEEIQSSAHTITAAPTSIAVFVGYTHPFKTKNFGQAVRLFGFTDYENEFGGFFSNSAFDDPDNFGSVAHAVNQFFLNGGSECYVVGLQATPLSGSPPSPAEITAPTVTVGGVVFTAQELTDADHEMTIRVDNLKPGGTSSPPADMTADITVTYGSGAGAQVEKFRQVSLDPGTPSKPNSNFIQNRIGTADSLLSSLIVVDKDQTAFPTQFTVPTGQTFDQSLMPHSPPDGSLVFEASDFTKVFDDNQPLDKVAIFNLLILPGVTDNGILSEAARFCEKKLAFLIIDPPFISAADDFGGKVDDEDTKAIESLLGVDFVPPVEKNAALYFPYIRSTDPVTGADIELPPAGTVAGIFGRTDLNRGVWKAPAGLETSILNSPGVVERGKMTDQQQGVLNPLGVNCLREFAGSGTVVFGARTMVTANPALSNMWRYVPVRRMALFLEQTLYNNLAWVVFEPNDEPLWAAIRTSIEAFMLGLFRQGAFQGSKPSEAFQVKCDSQTTTQSDIDNGIVNIVVAFAPLKPAEFVVIKIAQLAGQTQTS
jgi:phage tail sheath protein FI